jgi:uncharacterized protein DUF1194
MAYLFAKPWRFSARWIAAFCVAVAGSTIGTVPARTQTSTEVDLALVLAVDISYSMDEDEQRLQREGYFEALRSPIVLEAIRKGAVGRIAVTYMEWAGTTTQQVIAPWQIIEGRESAEAFIDKIAANPIRRAYRTSVSGAIDYGVKLLDEAPVRAFRRVIDVSGDGPNNQGRFVTLARDEAVAKGITINGLPIVLKRPGYLDIENLDFYYEDCVIGGRGAFMVPIRERNQFADATRNKLLQEIAGLVPDEPLIRPAQARQARISCVVGERQWNERMGN